MKFGVHHSELFFTLGCLHEKVAKVMVTGTVLNIEKKNVGLKKRNVFYIFANYFAYLRIPF